MRLNGLFKIIRVNNGIQICFFDEIGTDLVNINPITSNIEYV